MDEDIFHTEGSAVQDILTGANVLEKLMVNGSRTKLAKRARRLVSVHNHTSLWKDEPKAVQVYANNQRNKDYYERKKRKSLIVAAENIPMAKMTAFFSPQVATTVLRPRLYSHYVQTKARGKH